MPDLTQEGLAARGVRVRELVWELVTLTQTWQAKTIVGEYSVGFDDGWWAQLEGVEFWDWEAPEDPRSYSGPEAGMLACKADYAARILAPLEDTGEPALIREAEAQGMERVAAFIEGFDAPLADQIRAEATALRKDEEPK